MKTLLALLLILALTTAAMLLDAHRLDASVLFAALAVAVLFAFALNDRPRRRQPPMATRLFKYCSAPSAQWTGRKECIFCAGAAS